LWRSKCFWAVAALAFLLRLGAFLAVDRPSGLFHPLDSAEYDRLGWNLAAHGSYSLAKTEPHTPDLTRTPVYPGYVAFCYSVFGHRPAVVVASQLVMGTATCLLVYALAAILGGPRAGCVSGVLLAVDPLSVTFSALLMSETLFTLLFTGSLCCLVSYARRPRVGAALATATLASVALMCRPIAILWPLTILLVCVVSAWTRGKWQPLVHAGLVALLVAVTVGSWVVRNQRVGGLPVLSTVQGINLYYHRAARIVAAEDNISLAEAQRLLERRLHESPEEETAEPASEYHHMERAGREIILGSPGVYLSLHAQGVGRMMAPRDNPLPGPLPAQAAWWIEAGFLTVLYGLACIGLMSCARVEMRLGLLLGLVLVYFAVLSGPEAYARFRVPLMPALAVLAGLGAAALTSQFRVKADLRDSDSP
jgi:4-amino-4-deoxy-L-arabinose transferase-like glycosyltransferase